MAATDRPLPSLRPLPLSQVGPCYPFDNGPTGLNTLATASWVNSTGLLVLADPDTPFLHVGLNAPVTRRFGAGSATSPNSAAVRTVTSRDPGPDGGGGGPGSGGLRRAWGVGVQNVAREYLPRASTVAASPSSTSTLATGGDGQLRIQARASYRCPRISHPLSDWTRHDADGAALPAWAASVASAVEEAAVAVVRGVPPPPPDSATDAAGHKAADASTSGPWLSVSVALISTPDPRAATLAGLAPLPPPRRTPSKDALELPIWTTWARYFSGVDQAKCLALASEVAAHGFPRSVFEVDDRWQTAVSAKRREGEASPLSTRASILTPSLSLSLLLSLFSTGTRPSTRSNSQTRAA